MPFLTYEASVESGSPVELYRFALGNELFLYTSAEEEYVSGIETYEPIEISRNQISSGGQDERNTILNIQVPSTNPFVNRFILVVPGQRATLTIYRLHRYDTPTPEQALAFKGIIRSVAFSDGGDRAQIAVMPLNGALGRNFPKFTYQGLCNHVLFDARCKAPEGTFTYTGHVSALSGSQITVDGLISKGAGWAVGGLVTDQLRQDFRLVLSQSGDVITILAPFSSNLPILGTDVDVLAGCDHSISTCGTKFNNVTNYGGFQFVPGKNPFETGI